MEAFLIREALIMLTALPIKNGDSPAIPVQDIVKYATLGDTFETYLMFLPPGADSLWVPLAETKWHTDFNATRPNFGTPGSGHWSDFPANTSVGNVIRDSDFADQHTHPSW